MNPVVGTFQWLDRVEEAFGDKERGEPNSLAILKVTLHTVWRKRAYELWASRSSDTPLTEFNRKFATAAVARVASHFELTEDDVERLRREFGLPPAAEGSDRRDETVAPASGRSAG